MRIFDREDYRRYVMSAEWKAIRTQVFTRDNWHCVVCFSDKKLRAHHRTYIRLGRELISDLSTLCKRCHKIVHALDYTPKIIYEKRVELEIEIEGKEISEFQQDLGACDEV